MTKQGGDPTVQLTLDLSDSPRSTEAGAPSEPRVLVPFVDASTIAARRAAIARVRFSGIFAVPDRTRLEG